MSEKQLDMFGPMAGVREQLENKAARASASPQLSVVELAPPSHGLPAPLPPEQAHLERYACPVCSNDGMPHCFCDRVGHISREQALAFLKDFPGLPIGPRLPVPPTALDEPCKDCAFRGDSPEREVGTLPQIKRGSAFYCHVGMPLGHGDTYQPLAQTAAGEPVGHPLCAGWLASARRNLTATIAAALTNEAHLAALHSPALTPPQLWLRLGLGDGPSRAHAWLAYQHAVRALSPQNKPLEPPGYPAAWSPCRQYRYVLWRRWGLRTGPYMAVIGLNPSKADENKDDPTLRRCIHFAKREGCAQLAMINLFAFRATQPGVMMSADDPIGPENDRWLRAICAGASIVLVAWGNYGAHADQARCAEMLLREAKIKAKCFGWTASGQPLHPLYQANAAPLFDFGKDGPK